MLTFIHNFLVQVTSVDGDAFTWCGTSLYMALKENILVGWVELGANPLNLKLQHARVCAHPMEA